MKTYDTRVSELVRKFSTIRFLIHLTALLPLAASAAELRISDWSIDGQGRFNVVYPSDPRSYYILVRGPLDSISAPRKVGLGQNGQGTLADLVGTDTEGFFQIREVPKNSPLDLDGDGINDVYEILNNFDPLNSVDGGQDQDGDGRSNLEEYDSFSDPQIAGDPPLARPTIVFSPPRVIAKSGQTDTAGRTLAAIDRLPSMNDFGWVVFMGKIRDEGGVVRRNIYSVDPATGEIRPLMNATTSFELPELVSNEAPAQLLNAPMINNRNEVVAWRRLNARVLIGLDILNAPLTYIEAWSPTGNPTPGMRDMPIGTIASGNAGVAAAAGLLTWLNPLTAGQLPSPYNPGSPWVAIQGSQTREAFPTVNNLGQVAFCGLGDSSINFLSSDGVFGPAASFRLTGIPRRPKIADDGTVISYIEEGGSREIAVFSYANMTARQTLVSVGANWLNLGSNPNISDDGSCIAFYGELSPTGGTNLSLTPGSGIFAAVRNGVNWRFHRIAGVSGNGQLDPGEEEVFVSEFAMRDQGPFGAFTLDDRCGVANGNAIAYLATLTNGSKAVCVTHLDAENSAKQVAAIIAKQGDPLPGTNGTIQSLSLYDPLNNSTTPRVTFWAEGNAAPATNVVLQSAEMFSVRSRDRMVCFSFNKTEIEKLAAEQGGTFARFIVALPDGEGLEVGSNYSTSTGGEDGTTVLYDADNRDQWFAEPEPDDPPDSISRLSQDPQLRARKEFVTARRDPITGDEWRTVYVLANAYGEASIEVFGLGPDPLASARVKVNRDDVYGQAINAINDHVEDFNARPAGFFAELRAIFASERQNITKIAALLFDYGTTPIYLTLGAIDGFTDGVKGDVEGVLGIPETIGFLHTLYEDSRVRATVWGHITTRATEIYNDPASEIHKLYSSIIAQVDDRLTWSWHQPTVISRLKYVEGYIVGWGAEQAALTALTAGIGRAALTTVKATRAGTVVLSSLSAARKGLTAAVYDLSRFLPKEKLAQSLKAVRSELGAVFPGGISPLAQTLFEQSATLRRFAVTELEEISEIIARNSPEFLGRAKGGLVCITQELGVLATAQSLKGFALCAPRLIRQSSDFFEKLPLVFRGDKQRLERALADYVNHGSRPDNELLTLLYVAKKEVAPLEHPELLRFKQTVERLAPEPSQGKFSYAEGIAGARYQARTGEQLVRPPSGSPRWDFENSSGLKIEVKGPVVTGNSGTFVPVAYDRTRSLDLVDSVRREISQSQAQKIVVDKFGFDETEAAFIEAELQRLRSTTSIIIESQ